MNKQRPRPFGYHGLFAPHAKLRSRIVPSVATEAHAHAPPAGSLALLTSSLQPQRQPCSPTLPPAGGGVPVPSAGAPLPSPSVASSGASAPSAGDQTAVTPGRAYCIPWAELLQKVFAIDVLACPVCHGRMKLIAYINSASVARRILAHLGLPTTGPPLAKASLPDGEGCDSAPDHEQADPVWDE